LLKDKTTEKVVLPKNPLTVLTAIRVSTFGLKAVGICNNANIEKQTRYSFRLPNVSDSGAKIKGPIPRKTTKPVVAPTIFSLEVPRSFAISPMPGVNMLDAKGESTILDDINTQFLTSQKDVDTHQP